MANELIKVENLVPEDVFKVGGTDTILKAIKDEVSKFEPDITTDKGRQAIKSMARKVSSSKTFLEKLGKNVKLKYQEIIEPIDAERKKMRDTLDELRDSVRSPLTEWEAEQKRKEEEESARVKFEADFEEALAENAMVDREREIAAKEAELKRQEDERRAKEEAERVERDRIEYEDRLKKEAAEQAKFEAEEKAERERQEAIKKQIEAEQAIKRAEEERIQAQARAKSEAEQAEQRRISDLKAAEEKAKREQEEALERQRFEQAEKERIEHERKERKRIENETRIADYEHRGEVNGGILKAFVELGLDSGISRLVIEKIIMGEIDNISINY